MYTDKLSQVITTRRTNLSFPSSSKLATLSQRYSLLHNPPFSHLYPSSSSHRIACAFHPSETITNFCKNKQCLLPLCPVCVKIHTMEHQSLGTFGDFCTFEEVVTETRAHIETSFSFLEQLHQKVSDLKYQNDAHIKTYTRIIHEARHLLHKCVDELFDVFQSQWRLYSDSINEKLWADIFKGQQMMQMLAERLQEDEKKIKKSYSMMDSIIHNYSSSQQWNQLMQIAQDIKHNSVKFVTIEPNPCPISQLIALIDKYLPWTIAKEQVILSPSEQITKPGRIHFPRAQKYFFRPEKYKKQSEELLAEDHQNDKIHPQDSFSFENFRSPLDGFSLSKLREAKRRL